MKRILCTGFFRSHGLTISSAIWLVSEIASMSLKSKNGSFVVLYTWDGENQTSWYPCQTVWDIRWGVSPGSSPLNTDRDSMTDRSAIYTQKNRFPAALVVSSSPERLFTWDHIPMFSPSQVLFRFIYLFFCTQIRKEIQYVLSVMVCWHGVDELNDWELFIFDVLVCDGCQRTHGNEVSVVSRGQTLIDEES
jgi:hypothetical protein